jgi:hypothetical protein
VINILVNIHFLGLLNVYEEFLSVRPDLSPGSGSDEPLYFLPVFAVNFETYRI